MNRIEELIGLLRREGHHSGVWFSARLLEAADTISTLYKALDRSEKFLRRLAEGDSMVMAYTLEEEADAAAEQLRLTKGAK